MIISKRNILFDITQIYNQCKRSKLCEAKIIASLLYSVQEASTYYLLPGNLYRYRVRESTYCFPKTDVKVIAEMFDDLILNKQVGSQILSNLTIDYFKITKVKVGRFEKVYFAYPLLVYVEE